MGIEGSPLISSSVSEKCKCLYPLPKMVGRTTSELMCCQPHLSPWEDYEESSYGIYFHISYGQGGD